MTTFLARLFGVILLVTLTPNALAQTTATNVRSGVIPAMALRGLPVPQIEPETVSNSLTRSNTAGLGLNASRVPDRAIQPAPAGARAEFGLMKISFPLDDHGV